MKYPFKNYICEKLQQSQNMSDEELLALLQKEGFDISQHELNNILFHMEIAGLITVRWMGKDKRRIELLPRPQAQEHQS